MGRGGPQAYRDVGRGCPAESIAFSRDGKVLAVGDYYGNVTLWDVATRNKAATLPEGSEVSTVAFSPDRRTLAVGDVNGDLDLWDVVNRQRIATVNEGGQVDQPRLRPGREEPRRGRR